MVRSKSIVVFISLLLFSAMTLTETIPLYFEQGEVLESQEVEPEELKEGKERLLDWLKLLLCGGADGLAEIPNESLQRMLEGYTRKVALQKNNRPLLPQVPLFIMYCRLKISHHSSYS